MTTPIICSRPFKFVTVKQAENGRKGSISLFPCHLCFLPAGCMAESLKKKLLEADKSVDLVVGPGKYALYNLTHARSMCR
jgi:hypothetical protein